MKTSEVLRSAKQKLRRSVCDWGRDAVFLCNAIQMAMGCYEVKKPLWERIRTSLDESTTVYEWLKRRGFYLNRDEMQEYRHRWIDELIREYEAKGD